MKIEDNEVLHKIIDFQSCIIEGRNIKALLRSDVDFFLEKSGADIIVIYMHEHGKVNPEYILEKGNNFKHLLKKYILDKVNFKWEKLVNNCDIHFSSTLKYDEITDLYQMFKGFISKKNSDIFTNQLEMKKGVMMPIYDFKNKNKLGYTCYIFRSESKVKKENIKTVQSAFQTLLRPLYDTKYDSIYNKCIRIDQNMDLLTIQEKKIVKIVLTGRTYVETAEILDISINTLKTHMKNIFNKYNVSSKVELTNKFQIHLQ